MKRDHFFPFLLFYSPFHSIFNQKDKLMYYRMCFKIGDELKKNHIDTILSIIEEETYDPSFLLHDNGYVAYGVEDN